MSRSSLQVGIVGAGTAGCAAALFLSRAGHAVTLYERVEHPSAVGAGILLQPTGAAVLTALGLHDDVVSRGARVTRLLATNAKGRRVLDLEYSLVSPGLAGIGLHRGVLFEALFGATSAGQVDVRCGVDVVSATQDQSGRTTLVDAHGQAHGPHDLLVIADGARSRLRTALFPEAIARPYPWGALWFVGEDRDQRFAGALRQHLRDTRTMFGLLPTGLGPAPATTPLVSLFWSVPLDSVERLRTTPFSAWKERILELAPEAAPLLGQLDSWDGLTVAPYMDVRMPRWHDRGVVVIGDAAHATSPQLGQGANLALVDALVLSDALSVDRPVEASLQAYARRRRSHLRYYQLASRGLTPLFQSNASWLAPLRDVGLSIACRTPWLRTQMVATMAGGRTGIGLTRLSLPVKALPGP